MQTHSSPPLRIGLMLDSLMLTRWEYRMLEILLQSEYANLCLVILNETPPPPPKSLLKKIRDNYDTALFSVYDKLEGKLGKPAPDAFAKQDASDLLKAIPTLRVLPRLTKFSDYFQDKDVAEVRDFQLDVLVRLGFRILRGEILQAARYGVWSYHHGDNQVNRGLPAGFWEVMENHPTTGSILQILNEELDNGLVLSRSYSSTFYLSVAENRNNFFWKTVSLLPRKLAELHRDGADQVFARAKAQVPTFNCYSNRLYTHPKNGEMARLLLRHAWKYLRLKLRDKLYRKQWILLFDLKPAFSGSFWRYKKLVPPKDRFWADPHVIYRDGTYFIFVEELPFATEKGHISVITMDAKGNASPAVKVLERPYHLSYPFVFEWQGETYMIPETGRNRSIEVYKCVQFPNEWKLEQTLMEGKHAVDATLIEKDGKWWMFANIKEHEGASTWDELFLFYADSPLSKNWTPHPRNPLISDVRRARPGGAIFSHNGQLYRPSQNCSKGYAYGLKINRILTLNETDYEEEEVASIEPNWDRSIFKTHTLVQVGNLNLIDGMMYRPRYWN